MLRQPEDGIHLYVPVQMVVADPVSSYVARYGADGLTIGTGVVAIVSVSERCSTPLVRL